MTAQLRDDVITAKGNVDTTFYPSTEVAPCVQRNGLARR